MPLHANDTASTLPNGHRNVKFCPYCGEKLDPGARFCKNCGEPISVPENHDPDCGNPTRRETVYEGKIHKCPNCGEVLESFQSICPSCGNEIRDARSASSVRELTQKLEMISARKMPPIQEKNSVMKMIFGRDLKENDEVEDALRRFERQKNEEKASLIINYSVPNTREDILEFIILASSNIDAKEDQWGIVRKAWITKLDQVYRKAELSMGDSEDFAQIKKIYERKKNDLSRKKKIVAISITAFCICGLLVAGLILIPVATVIIVATIIVFIMSGYIIFKK